MNQANPPSKIAFVSDYLPRRCGIATFTYDLRDAVAAQYPDVECGVLAINDLPEGYDYREEVRFEIQEQRLRDYQEAVNFLRFNGFDVLCLQHEFGIYGGRSGSHILTILRQVDLPVVTTLHTILRGARSRPTPGDGRNCQAIGTTGRDDRARAHDSARDLWRSGGQDRPDRARHSGYAVRRSETPSKISSGSKAGRSC